MFKEKNKQTDRETGLNSEGGDKVDDTGWAATHPVSDQKDRQEILMASNILAPERFSKNLTLDLLTEVAPELDTLDGESLLEKLSDILQPALNSVVAAYKLASATEVTGQAFQLFLQNLVVGAGEDD